MKIYHLCKLVGSRMTYEEALLFKSEFDFFIADFEKENSQNPTFKRVFTHQPDAPPIKTTALWFKHIQDPLFRLAISMRTPTEKRHDTPLYSISRTDHHDHATTLRLFPPKNHPLRGFIFNITEHTVITHIVSAKNDKKTQDHSRQEIDMKLMEITYHKKPVSGVFIADQFSVPRDFFTFHSEYGVSDRTKILAKNTIPVHCWGEGNYTHLDSVLNYYTARDRVIIRTLDPLFTPTDPTDEKTSLLVIDHGCGSGRLSLSILEHFQKHHPQRRVHIIAYDPNTHAIPTKESADDGKATSLQFIHGTTDVVTPLIHEIGQKKDRLTFKKIIHIDSGGPFHLQVVSYEDAKKNMAHLMSMHSHFPEATEIHLVSSGQSPHFYDHTDLESLGFKTLTFGQPHRKENDNLQLYHGVIQLT